MAANSMLLRLKHAESAPSNEAKDEEIETKHWNKKRNRQLNDVKCGWMKKRSRHLKKWRKRFTQIEEQQYLCTYNDETFKHCTEKIDIKQARIHYTINEPTEFHIYYDKKNKKNTEFWFQCESIEEATDWLRHLKKINGAQPHSNNENVHNMNDLDLITDENAISRPNIPSQPGHQPKEVSDLELNQLYIKALSLYQLKMYDACQNVTKSVLTVHPTHPEALKLSEYLINRQYDTVSEKKSKRNVRSRFKTVDITKSSSKQPKHKKVFSVNISLFKNRKNEKHAIIADELKDEMQNDNSVEEEQQNVHPCRLEFKRFMTERIQLSEFYDDLIEQFKVAKYDDIRFLKDFDREILGNEIGLRPLHVKCFLRKIEIFMNEVKLFQEWLKQIAMEQKRVKQFRNLTSDGLIDLFENGGITTFEALYRKIQSKQDLKSVITGDLELDHSELKKVYDVIWNSMDHIEKKQASRIRRVSLSYSEVDARLFGKNDYGINDMDVEDIIMEGVEDEDMTTEGVREGRRSVTVKSDDVDDFDAMFVQQSEDDKGTVLIAEASEDMLHAYIVKTPKEDGHGDNQDITKGGHEYYDKFNEEVWKRRNENQ